MSPIAELVKEHCGVVLVCILTIYFLIVAVLFVASRFCYKLVWNWKEIPTKDGNRTLIVIAHPDDEAMFFGPTIRGLLKRGQLYVLCFSYGDYEGIGQRRKAELWKSCKALGILEGNITIMKHGKLRDDPRCKWPIAHLAAYIRNHVISHGITTLVTFDDYGISGHANHIALYNSIVDLLERHLLPSYCRVFSLISVNVLRKYILGIFDVPYCFFFNEFVYMTDGNSKNSIVTAMECHESQMIWFRRLYVILSRYMLINSLEELRRPQLKYATIPHNLKYD